jgi:hypothetical protein
MNLHPILWTALGVTLSFSPVRASDPPKPESVQVLVLGTYHFGNPGRDLHNMQVDDVRTPAKQAELADVAARLAKFKPTKIAVEAISDRTDFAYAKYDGFVPEMLTKNSDERVQIGFRLAKNLGLKIVYGIDEQSETIDYFPYGKVESFAKEHNQAELLTKLGEQAQGMMKEMEAAQKTTPINRMLARMNDPAQIAADNREFYYALLRVGDGTAQPGAELNGGWYLRNAKIFSKLSQITQPGDKVVVLFGAGHAYWLRHFAQNTPGFTLIEAADYLR